MNSWYWLLFWLLLLFGGVRSTVTPPESAFSLNYRAGTAAMDGAVGITFADVVEDSRCPTAVTCVQAGRVVVELDVQVGGQAPVTVYLGGMTDDRGVLAAAAPGRSVTSQATVDGYAVQLLAVMPYPVTAPADKADYQIQLQIGRAAE